MQNKQNKILLLIMVAILSLGTTAQIVDPCDDLDGANKLNAEFKAANKIKGVSEELAIANKFVERYGKCSGTVGEMASLYRKFINDVAPPTPAPITVQPKIQTNEDYMAEVRRIVGRMRQEMRKAVGHVRHKDDDAKEQRYYLIDADVTFVRGRIVIRFRRMSNWRSDPGAFDCLKWRKIQTEYSFAPEDIFSVRKEKRLPGDEVGFLIVELKKPRTGTVQISAFDTIHKRTGQCYDWIDLPPDPLPGEDRVYIPYLIDDEDENYYEMADLVEELELARY